jgi:hypothetical protein
MHCSKCKSDLPATAEFFSPLKNKRGRGFDYWCRRCKNASKRRYRRGIQGPSKKFARRVAYEMYSDEFRDRCLKGLGTTTPCPNKATWKARSADSEWRACDEHRLKTDVIIPNEDLEEVAPLHEVVPTSHRRQDPLVPARNQRLDPAVRHRHQGR